jgi:hypothetical protein
LSTLTPGLSGEARYQELVKRLSLFGKLLFYSF